VVSFAAGDDAVERAPELERPGDLQILKLQRDGTAVDLSGEYRRRAHVRANCVRCLKHVAAGHR
jgi:hypothetical protein